MTPTDVLRVPGNYLIDAKNGDVTINVTNGTTTGTVYVVGKLSVLGPLTQIESVDTVIEDNILILNSGEVNNYITKGTSGIAIARGDNDNLNRAAKLLFNDNVSWYDSSGNQFDGVFEFSAGFNGISTGTAIRVNGIRSSGGLDGLINFLGSEHPSGMLNVKGTVDYELNVLDDDDIPNKKYVDEMALTTQYRAKKVQVGNTVIKAFSPLDLSPEFYDTNDKIEAGLGTSTNVVFRLEGTSALVQGIFINNNSIQVSTGTANLILDPPLGQAVEITSPIKLIDTTQPSPDSGSSYLYFSDPPQGGGTGLFFVNTTANDELISRRRALLYSIIF